jgi:signal peptidase I
MKPNKIWEYTKAIGMALILSLIIRASIVQAYKTPSGSMIPTLLIGDHLLANKFVYGISIPLFDKKILALSNPQRGDIIIFSSPQDPSKDLINPTSAYIAYP